MRNPGLLLLTIVGIALLLLAGDVLDATVVLGFKDPPDFAHRLALVIMGAVIVFGSGISYGLQSAKTHQELDQASPQLVKEKD